MTEEQLIRLERCVSTLETLTDDMSDHETRLRAIEKRQWYAAGAIALVAFAVPLLMSFAK